MSTRYKLLTKPEHPNANASGRIYEHIFVMSEILGRSLNKGEVVHHEDADGFNNSPNNLMLFASQAEHLLYHTRQRALLECGNSAFRKCCYCGVYDCPETMSVHKTRHTAYHKSCAASYKKNQRQESKFNESAQP